MSIVPLAGRWRYQSISGSPVFPGYDQCLPRPDINISPAEVTFVVDVQRYRQTAFNVTLPVPGVGRRRGVIKQVPASGRLPTVETHRPSSNETITGSRRQRRMSTFVGGLKAS